jgi:hypothetical protein
MKNFISRLETLLVSITFAEAGEHATSQQILSQPAEERHEEALCPAR